MQIVQCVSVITLISTTSRRIGYKNSYSDFCDFKKMTDFKKNDRFQKIIWEGNCMADGHSDQKR